jgi:hypothetical protein
VSMVGGDCRYGVTCPSIAIGPVPLDMMHQREDCGLQLVERREQSL